MRKSKAIVWRAQPDGTVRSGIEMINVDEPMSGEVMVKVQSCGICHTDVTYANYQVYGPVAMFGHEGCGIVEAVGPGVTKVQPGDHVIMSLISGCGKCKSCLKGITSQCEEYNLSAHMVRPDGSSPYTDENGERIDGSYGAAFTEYMVTRETSIIRIDDNAPDYFGVFSCGIQTGVGTLFHECNPEPGDSLAVFGCGMVGLGAIIGAKIRGMYPIIAVASPRSPKKIEAARKLGATHVIINTKETDVLEEIHKIAPHGVDFCIDTAGGTELTPMAVRCTNEHLGKAVLIGTADLGASFTLNPMDIMLGRTVSGASIGKTNPNYFVPQLNTLYNKGMIPIEDCLSFYEFDDFEQAFQDFHDGKVIKAVIKIS